MLQDVNDASGSDASNEDDEDDDEDGCADDDDDDCDEVVEEEALDGEDDCTDDGIGADDDAGFFNDADAISVHGHDNAEDPFAALLKACMHDDGSGSGLHDDGNKVRLLLGIGVACAKRGSERTGVHDIVRGHQKVVSLALPLAYA